MSGLSIKPQPALAQPSGDSSRSSLFLGEGLAQHSYAANPGLPCVACPLNSSHTFRFVDQRHTHPPPTSGLPLLPRDAVYVDLLIPRAWFNKSRACVCGATPMFLLFIHYARSWSDVHPFSR